MRHWLQDRPALFEWAYAATAGLMRALDPLLRRVGYARLAPLFEAGERMTKETLFDCRMCGMCALHSTGMTCPMTCPKDMRNGPCGGVRPDGTCEVKPEMDCVWVQAWQRSGRMSRFGDEIMQVQPPVDRQLVGSSAWLNMLSGRDRVDPAGWDRTVTLHFQDEAAG